MKYVYLRSMLLSLFLTGSFSLTAEDSALLKERFQKAALANSLDTPEMKPWHLAMDFALLDAKGRPTQTGTIDELWASASLYKVSYTTGQSTWTEIVNHDGVFLSKGVQEPPELTTLLRRELVHPFPPEASIEEGLLALEQTQIGGVALDCIKFSHLPSNQDKPVPGAIYPVYCLDRDKTSLRVVTKYNTENFTRRTIGTYAGKSVAVDQSISFSGLLAAKSHLTELRSKSATDADFSPDATFSKVDDAPLGVAAQSVAGKLIKKVPPVYPEAAKREHISGTVLLHAIIGKDGHMVSLKPIYSPNPDLTDAALSVVRQWVYEPYILNGVPREVDTEITINFSFSR